MSETVSLEKALMERYAKQIAWAEIAIEEAERNLARVAMIYSGQLTLDVLEDDLRPLD